MQLFMLWSPNSEEHIYESGVAFTGLIYGYFYESYCHYLGRAREQTKHIFYSQSIYPQLHLFLIQPL